jgi:hypothetical protein
MKLKASLGRLFRKTRNYYSYKRFGMRLRTFVFWQITFEESELDEYREVMIRIGWREAVTGYHFFARTKGGRLGWVCPFAQHSDLVCIFNGAKFCHIIRPSNTNAGRYRLVGDCYMQGLMEGEVLDMPEIHEECIMLEWEESSLKHIWIKNGLRLWRTYFCSPLSLPTLYDQILRNSNNYYDVS